MPARLGRFEMPKSLTKDEASATETYAKFIAKPFEAGYGQTVGNSLRRVLLSSLEGAAITSIRIAGAQHEFATLTGIVEDVTDIVLNLKKIKFKAVDHEPRTVTINVNKEGQTDLRTHRRRFPMSVSELCSGRNGLEIIRGEPHITERAEL
jgi:DNA-directed RNA polymerase subunit alpha